MSEIPPTAQLKARKPKHHRLDRQRCDASRHGQGLPLRRHERCDRLRREGTRKRKGRSHDEKEFYMKAGPFHRTGGPGLLVLEDTEDPVPGTKTDQRTSIDKRRLVA